MKKYLFNFQSIMIIEWSIQYPKLLNAERHNFILFKNLIKNLQVLNRRSQINCEDTLSYQSTDWSMQGEEVIRTDGETTLLAA